MAPTPEDDVQAGNFRGVFWMLGATLVFVFMHASIRHIARDVNPLEIAFFRNVLGFVFLAPVFLRYGLTPLRTTRFRLHFWRAVINLINMPSGTELLSDNSSTWSSTWAEAGMAAAMPTFRVS